MSDRTRTPPETPTARRAGDEHVRPAPEIDWARSLMNADGVPTVPIDPATCPHCNHQHAGVEAANICIGCPCEYRPCLGAGQHTRAIRTGEVQDHGNGHEPVYLSHCMYCDKPFPPSEKMPRHWMIPWTEDDVKAVTFKTGKIMYGIEPTGVVVGFNPKPEGFTNLEKCDGDHPMPACKDPGCWHAEPPIGGARVLVRYVGPEADLLCECCELPLSAEPVTLVEIVDDCSTAPDGDDAHRGGQRQHHGDRGGGPA